MTLSENTIKSCILYTINRWEGGYVDDPDDPGGETKYGISKRKYPDVDIKNLSIDDAVEIYRRDYWGKIPMGDWGVQVCWKVFDIFVNTGEIHADDAKNGLNALIQTQALHYARIVRDNPKLSKFLVGWMNRTFDRGTSLVN